MEGLPSILAIKLMLPIRMPAMIATKDGARKCTLVTAGSRAHSTSPKRSPTKRASKQSRAKTPQKTHSVSPLGINMSDVDLHRAVILGLDQAVGGAALARDVQVDGGARCVLFAAARREKRQGRGAGRNKKTAPRRHHSRNAPQPPPASHATSEGLLTRPLVPRHPVDPAEGPGFVVAATTRAHLPDFVLQSMCQRRWPGIRPCSAPSWRPRVRAMMRRAR